MFTQQIDFFRTNEKKILHEKNIEIKWKNLFNWSQERESLSVEDHLLRDRTIDSSLYPYFCLYAGDEELSTRSKKIKFNV